MDGIKFKIGIIITVFNRWEFFRKTLISLNESILPDSSVYLVDDGSTDYASRLVEYYYLKHPVVRIIQNKNMGQACALKTGFDAASRDGCNILVNLDSDTLVKMDWLNKLLSLYRKYPDTIISGFNTLNHPIYQTASSFYKKESIGGINMLFNERIYSSVVRPHLNDNRWDWEVCRDMKRRGLQFIVSRPSVVQHIGTHSTCNHNICDVAHDF